MRIQLLQPAWLLLLPLPWLLAALWGRCRGATRFAPRELLARLRVPGPRPALPPAAALGWLLALLALAQPVQVQAPPREALGVDLAVVLDLSPSMEARDLAPSRLERARLELERLLERLRGRGDRLGLVAFAANAYPLLPPTADRALFRETVTALRPQDLRAGSHLGRALEVARRLLAGSPPGARAVLLLSDGEAHEAEDAARAEARALARAGIPLLALGLGTPEGAPVPGPDGSLLVQGGAPVRSRLHAEILRELARLTGGAYAEAAAGDPWPVLLRALEAATRPAPLEGAAGTHRHLAAWPLAAALALFLWSGLPRQAVPPASPPAVLALLAAVLLASPTPTRAGPWAAWEELTARRALLQGRPSEALAAYRALPGWRARLGEGAAAYRLGRLEEALAAFQQAAREAPGPRERAAARLDAGNALARLGRLEEAEAAWREALRLDPGLRAAALNLERLRTRLRALRLRPSPGDERPVDEKRAEAPAGAGPRGPQGAGEHAGGLEPLLRRWRAALGERTGPAPGGAEERAFAVRWLVGQADDTRAVRLLEGPPW